MYELKVDKGKNRLHLRMWGFVDAAQTKKCADHVLAEVKNLRPGFDVINDITDFKPTVEEAVTEIQRALAGLVKAGMRRSVRISPRESSVTSMQFSRAKREAHVDNQVATVKTLEEALKLLG
jgi:hypothetical protein